MRFSKWLIFDLGQVLVHFDTAAVMRRFLPHSRLSQAQLVSAIVHSPLIDEFERGLLSIDTFLAQLVELAQLDESISVDTYERFYTDIFIPSDGMLRRLAQLRRERRYGLALLSNTNQLHVNLLRRQVPTLFPLFDRLFLSMELGLRKPDHQVFRKVQSTLGVPPHSISYWDDLPANVEAARQVGWEAIVFKDLRDL